ncbi:hypothetical protein EDC96DRAFT_567325 [Choanephora cucurbitarum]|nr:hypothetical protein EDC96DRAFT_546870 [Choanephora cucurbitarum]KAI8350901.1 hypothetical protein EDC96DRAFT_567325 [Choanephora cucurbitarum]
MLLFSFFFLLFFISLSVYLIFIHKPKQQVKNSGQKLWSKTLVKKNVKNSQKKKCHELSEKKKSQKFKPKNSQRLWLKEKKCQELKSGNTSMLKYEPTRNNTYLVQDCLILPGKISYSVKNLSCHGLQASFQVSTSRSPFTVIKTGLLQERCGVQQGPGNPGGPGDSGRPILAGLNQSAIASTKGDVSGGAYERGSLSYQVGCLWLISKVLTFLLDTLWLSTYCYFSLVWPVYSFGTSIYCFSVVLVYQD